MSKVTEGGWMDWLRKYKALIGRELEADEYRNLLGYYLLGHKPEVVFEEKQGE